MKLWVSLLLGVVQLCIGLCPRTPASIETRQSLANAQDKRA